MVEILELLAEIPGGFGGRRAQRLGQLLLLGLGLLAASFLVVLILGGA